jgi:hypothetical protein
MKTLFLSAFMAAMAISGFSQSNTEAKISSFNADVNGATVICKWITSEDNSKSYYQMERSFDKRQFITIGYVLGAEKMVDGGVQYRFPDKSPVLRNRAVVYYRVRETNGGSVAFSNVLTVRLGAYATDNTDAASIVNRKEQHKIFLKKKETQGNSFAVEQKVQKK